MKRLAIVVGDITDHGGTVLTGSERARVEGLALALLGSDVTCPLHGATKIITGQKSPLIMGQPAVVEGNLTSCGARLLSRRQAILWIGDPSDFASQSEGIASTVPSSSAAVSTVSEGANTAPAFTSEQVNVTCDEYFQFITHQREPLAELNYVLVREDQCVSVGQLDTRGRSCVYRSAGPVNLQIAISAPPPALE